MKLLIARSSRSQWPRSLSRGSAVPPLLRLDSNPVGGMDVCLLSGRDLGDGPITRPEAFRRVWCVLTKCDRTSSIMRRPWPSRGFCAMKKNAKAKADEEVTIAEPPQCLSPVPNRRPLVTTLGHMNPVLKL